MPTYQYYDEEHGRTIELRRPVSRRDAVRAGLRRVRVPGSVWVTGARDPGDPDQAVPRALRQLEDKMSARAIVRESGRTVEEYKRIWNM